MAYEVGDYTNGVLETFDDLNEALAFLRQLIDIGVKAGKANQDESGLSDEEIEELSRQFHFIKGGLTQ